jgi:ABC-type transport system involved in cytochrome c biogenesis ATPase subunit
MSGTFMSSQVRLAEFRVERLFDEFSYTIPLKLDPHVTAIIAPNGTGKTLCLRMIHALFARRWSVFVDISFQRAIYVFTDHHVVEVEKLFVADKVDEGDAPAPFRVTVRAPDGEEFYWNPSPSEGKRIVSVERYIPFLSRIGPTKWRHDHTGEPYTITEVIEEWGDQLPPDVTSSIYGRLPPILDGLCKLIDCRLIETQRLLILRDHRRDVYHPPGSPTSTLAIAKKAQSIKEIIAKEINDYAKLSQSLDRSFPRRVIEDYTTISPDNLKDQLHDLEDKRRELTEAGILDTQEDDPVALPAGQIDQAIARVLSVYVEDNKKKLSSLDPLLQKIRLFKKLIDARFITKDVRITRKQGIEVNFRGDNVALDKLSSGEQHQLVLFFELLFEIKQNSLILIDEPELSLHVAWQKKFISDLASIIALNKFDVVLATHSPQLVSRWTDLVIELGDVDDIDAADS